MKNMFFLLLIVFISSYCLISCNDNGNSLDNQSELQPKQMRSIYFFNNSQGYVVGDSGLVMKTTDSGLTWTKIQTGYDDVRFNDVLFTSSSTGWVIGNDGIALRTTNGGYTWTLKTENYPAFFKEINLNSIIQVNNNYVKICGSKGRILLTSDQGSTWQKDQTSQSASLNKIVFFVTSSSSWTEYAVGDVGRILFNSTGAWANKSIESSKYDLSDIHLSYDSYGYVCGSNAYFAKTTDWGDTWTRYTIPDLGDEPSLIFVGFLVGWLVGEKGSIIKTTDGGVNWTQQISGTTKDLTDVLFLNNNFGFAIGPTDSLLRTTNGGTTWDKIPY